MSAEPSSILRSAGAPVLAAVPPRAGAREGRVRVLQFGPALEVRGGVSTVEQLIHDYLPPYANLRHVATMDESGRFSRLLVYGRAVRTLTGALESLEPTVFHIHFASRGSTLRKLLLAQLVIRARRPLILHAHGGGFDKFHRNLPPMLRRLVNRTLQQAHVLITLSSQWRDFYIRECELSPSQVVVLPNPVRIPARPVERPNRAEVQFLHLGKLGRSKGSFDLVQAFLALPEQHRSRARLVLAGNGDVDGVRRAAAAEPRIRVIPWVNAAERDSLLAESDVFALPSYAEGVPMSLLEAMAAGLPAITTPVGGIPDVFTAGVEGFFVTPGDHAALTRLMTQYIDDEAARLAAGRRAHERARQHDVHAYARALADIYQRIAPVAEIRADP